MLTQKKGKTGKKTTKGPNTVHHEKCSGPEKAQQMTKNIMKVIHSDHYVDVLAK